MSLVLSLQKLAVGGADRSRPDERDHQCLSAPSATCSSESVGGCADTQTLKF